MNTNELPTPDNRRLVSSDLLALCCFLAKYQRDLNTLRNTLISMQPEDAHDALIMQWPMIQGTRNQMNLTAIGNLPFEPAAMQRAVESILANNAVSNFEAQTSNEK